MFVGEEGVCVCLTVTCRLITLF